MFIYGLLTGLNAWAMEKTTAMNLSHYVNLVINIGALLINILNTGIQIYKKKNAHHCKPIQFFVPLKI